MAKYVILHPEPEGGYSVDIPDLKIDPQGETVAECISMARDAVFASKTKDVQCQRLHL